MGEEEDNGWGVIERLGLIHGLGLFRVWDVVGRVIGWEALGKAVSAEPEPRSVAEPNIRLIWSHC